MVSLQPREPKAFTAPENKLESSVWYQGAKGPVKVGRSSQEVQLGGGAHTKISMGWPDSKINRLYAT